jgi:hypothetical protein
MRFCHQSSNVQATDLVPDHLTNPVAQCDVGWSHGKEVLKHSQYDKIKGSNYATFMSSYLQAAHEDAQEQHTFK